MKYSDLVDLPKLQALMTSLSQATGIANAVIGVDGTVIVRAGWQDACTGFHRVNPETCRRCVASDTALAESMTTGTTDAVYQCHNGLVDTATPGREYYDIPYGPTIKNSCGFERQPWSHSVSANPLKSAINPGV